MDRRVADRLNERMLQLMSKGRPDGSEELAAGGSGLELAAGGSGRTLVRVMVADLGISVFTQKNKAGSWGTPLSGE